jgi:hypothetical protein
VERTDQQVPLRRLLLRIPAMWMLLGLLLLMATAVSFTPAGAGLAPFRGLAIAAGLGWGCGGWWLQSAQRQQRQHGLISLVSGSVIALALLFSSPLWLWELNETWSVRPVAALSRLSPGQPVQLQGYDERPSLNWYARQRIRRRRNSDAGWILTRKSRGNCVVSFRDGDWALARCR